MDELSTRQREILRLIRSKVVERGYPPSVREIGEVLAISANTAASRCRYALAALRRTLTHKLRKGR